VVHESLADASDRLVCAAIVVYALAMLALSAEWAFSNRRFAGGGPYVRCQAAAAWGGV
jgi:hypothetical protein